MKMSYDDLDLAPRAAAALLNEARATKSEEAIDRAVLALPDSRGARRLKVQQLLRAGDTSAADAMIAQMRLPWPTHPTLACLRAWSLLLQGERAQAEHEVRTALRARPHHVSTLVLAGRIARANSDLPLAVRRFEQAVTARPDSRLIKRHLIETLIDAESLAHAERVLATLPGPNHLLDARLLAAQGRLLDAIERLESVPAEAPRSVRDEAVSALINLRERVGNTPRLLELLSTVHPDDHQALIAAGRAWLAAGAHRTAFMRLVHLRRPSRVQAQALGILVVAAAMLDRPRMATRLLQRLQRTQRGADPREMAELWRRALTAQSLRDPLHVAIENQTGRDVLSPLIESAIEIFGSRPRATGRTPHAEHLAVLLAATGRPDAAHEVLARSTPTTPPQPTQAPTERPLRRAA